LVKKEPFDEKSIVHKGGKMNSYELIYAVIPNLPAEDTNELHEAVKSYITTSKGELKSFNDWGLKKLAYPIKHYYEAPYFFVEFDAMPKIIDELKNIIRLNRVTLRFAVIKIEKDFSKRKIAKRRPPKTFNSAPNAPKDEDN
jgi:small subunit ribosomal protein S6